MFRHLCTICLNRSMTEQVKESVVFLDAVVELETQEIDHMVREVLKNRQETDFKKPETAFDEYSPFTADFKVMCLYVCNKLKPQRFYALLFYDALNYS